jgi:EmrB/QacA subfamily drug resistance transporter
MSAPQDTLTTTPFEPAHAQRSLLIGLMAPALITGIYISMFSVTIPAIRAEFNIAADTAAWVATIYNLPFMMFMPLYGRLGDVLGKRRLLMMGMTIFMVGTILAALANNLTWLMVGRAIQGLGTAGFVPLSLAIIAQRFSPRERGKIMGTWNMAFPFTGIIGPFVGGFLVDYLSWRAIFWPVIFLGPLAFLTMRQRIPPLSAAIQPDFLRRFDWGGVVLLSLTSTALLFYASSRPITGVDPLRDWRLLIAMVVLATLFIFWELRQSKPFVPLNIFGFNTFTLASLCAGIRMFTMAGVRFLVPLYLVDIHLQSATTIGLVITAHSIPLLLLLRLGGQLADRWGSRWPVIFSLLFQAVAMAYLALLSPAAPIWAVLVGVMGQSTAAGFSLAPLHRASTMGISEANTGVGAGLYSMLRFAGTVFGTALSGVVLQYGLNQGFIPIEAYQLSFWFVAVVTVLGMLIGLGMKA